MRCLLVPALSQGMSSSHQDVTGAISFWTVLNNFLNLIRPKVKENYFLSSFITKPSNIFEIHKGLQHPMVQAAFWE